MSRLRCRNRTARIAFPGQKRGERRTGRQDQEKTVKIEARTAEGEIRSESLYGAHRTARDSTTILQIATISEIHAAKESNLHMSYATSTNHTQALMG